MLPAFPQDGPRPEVAHGDYLLTKPAPTTIVCKAYDQPFPDGAFIAIIAPGTYLGPVEEFLHTETYVTVLVKGYWINIWRRKPGSTSGVTFATVIARPVVHSWIRAGWQVW